MTTFVFSRDDFANPYHPRFWEDMCDDLDLDPKKPHQTYPDQIEVVVKSAKRLDD